MDAAVTPRRVLPGKADNQLPNDGRGTRTTASWRPLRWVGPVSSDQLPVPTKQRLRSHDPHPQEFSRQHPGQRDQHKAVLRLQPRTGHLPAQHRHLRSQHKQFDVLRRLTTTAGHQKIEQHPQGRIQAENSTRMIMPNPADTPGPRFLSPTGVVGPVVGLAPRRFQRADHARVRLNSGGTCPTRWHFRPATYPEKPLAEAAVAGRTAYIPVFTGVVRWLNSPCPLMESLYFSAVNAFRKHASEECPARRRRPSSQARLGTTLSLTGIATVVWGVFTFNFDLQRLVVRGGRTGCPGMRTGSLDLRQPEKAPPTTHGYRRLPRRHLGDRRGQVLPLSELVAARQ